MSFLPEMEWNGRWEWENFVMFGSKGSETPKKVHLADWSIVDDGEIDAGSANLSGSGGDSGASGSSGVNGSSAISASTASSLKDDMNRPRFKHGSSISFSKNMETSGTDFSETSPPVEASLVSMEPLTGLKLSLTYFENCKAGNIAKSMSVTELPSASNTTTNKTKLSGQNALFARCQVEGCNLDLSTAKDYHRKHRVCASHSKSPKVVIGGFERRFCQQCSRFHSLSEFDEKKRSCRRRLSDHNARRRKPQQEAIQFNSTRFSSPFYGGGRQMNFLSHTAPLTYPRAAANSAWDGTGSTKFTVTEEFLSKSSKIRRLDGQPNFPGTNLPSALNVHGNAPNGLLALKGTTSEVSNAGMKGSVPSQLDAAPEYRCALSLLSSNPWASSESDPIPLEYPVHEKEICINQPVHPIPQGLPLTSSEFWPTAQQPSPLRSHVLAANTNFQEIQLFKPPYEPDFY